MTRVHAALVFVAATAGLAAVAAGSDTATPTAGALESISALDLAERIRDAEPALHVFDLRARADYEQLHVPTAEPLSLDRVSQLDLPRTDAVVLYGDGAVVDRARVLLQGRGYTRVSTLREGIYEWTVRVLEPQLPLDATPLERAAFDRAAALSRFFGGLPRMWIARSDLSPGYWTGQSSVAADVWQQAVRAVRKRGC